MFPPPNICRTAAVLLGGLFSAILQTCGAESSGRPVTMAPESEGLNVILPFYRNISIRCSTVPKHGSHVQFSWYHNGTELKKQSDSSLQIGHADSDVLRDQTQGSYRCEARNTHGTATSKTYHMRKARMDPVPASFTRSKAFSGAHGEWLTLSCVPPNSFPAAKITWQKKVDQLNTRILTPTRWHAMDAAGSLHFASLNASDAGQYECRVANEILVDSYRSRISVTVSSDVVVPSTEPVLLYSTPSQSSALKGSSLELECIFSGSYTEVEWKFPAGVIANSYSPDNSRKIRIDRVGSGHSGTYSCTPAGGGGSSHDIEVTVESQPKWSVEPSSLTVLEGDSAQFNCEAAGKPSPSVQWFFNANSTPQGTGYSLTLSNIPADGGRTIQCVATNKHGVLLKNVYLELKSFPPKFTTQMEKATKVVAGTDVLLPCAVKAGPRPIVEWFKGGVAVTSSAVLSDSTLKLMNVNDADEDSYECLAKNKYGNESIITRLKVLQPTEITSKQMPLKEVKGSTINLKCKASVDLKELTNLTITWRRETESGQSRTFPRSDVTVVKSASAAEVSNTLSIDDSNYEDSGSYVCTVSNGVDLDSYTSSVLITGPPESAHPLSVGDCATSPVTISWSPKGDRGEPVTRHLLEYRAKFKATGVVEEEESVSSQLSEQAIGLQPWASYAFRVILENANGLGDPSPWSQMESCTTPATRPTSNPSGVRSASESPDNLKIVWTPLDVREWKGPGFYYLIRWRLAATSQCPGSGGRNWCVKKVTDGSQSELSVPHDDSTHGPYTEYTVTVASGNNEGKCETNPVEVEARSGEDVPAVTVSDFSVNPELENPIGPTNVSFAWTQPNISDVAMKGRFEGYEIVYMYGGREEMLKILPNPSLLASSERKRRGRSLLQADKIDRKEIAEITGLPPYTDISFQVAVSNGRYRGPLVPTPPIKVTTLTGRPSRPALLGISQVGPTHITLYWNKPESPNGIIIHYTVQTFSCDEPQLAQLHGVIVSGLSYKVSDLSPTTCYDFRVAGVTTAGKGQEGAVEEAKTIELKAPAPPVITLERLSPNGSLTVAWHPKPPGTPPAYHYVKYRELGTEPWEISAKEEQTNRIMLSGIDATRSFEVIAVASNGPGFETEGEKKTVSALGKPAPASEGLSPLYAAPWFIGLMVGLVLLIILLALVFIVRKSRGGRYNVPESERLTGKSDSPSPGDTDWPNKHPKGGKGDPDVRGPLLGGLRYGGPGGGSDSALEDTNSSLFNEDGSFIGQYAQPDQIGFGSQAQLNNGGYHGTQQTKQSHQVPVRPQAPANNALRTQNAAPNALSSFRPSPSVNSQPIASYHSSVGNDYDDDPPVLPAPPLDLSASQFGMTESVESANSRVPTSVSQHEMFNPIPPPPGDELSLPPPIPRPAEGAVIRSPPTSPAKSSSSMSITSPSPSAHSPCGTSQTSSATATSLTAVSPATSAGGEFRPGGRSPSPGVSHHAGFPRGASTPLKSVGGQGSSVDSSTPLDYQRIIEDELTPLPPPLQPLSGGLEALSGGRSASSSVAQTPSFSTFKSSPDSPSHKPTPV